MLWQRKAQSRGFREHSSMSGKASGVCRVGGVCLHDLLSPLSQVSASAPSSLHFPTARVWAGRALPSQVIMGPGSSRLCTGTFEASYDIGAGASPTGVPDGALICVCGGEVRGWAGPS